MSSPVTTEALSGPLTIRAAAPISIRLGGRKIAGTPKSVAKAVAHQTLITIPARNTAQPTTASP